MWSLERNALLRFEGPGRARFIIQPLIAVFLGFRDGLQDYREGRPPYGFDLFTNPSDRSRLWKNGVRAIFKPLLLAFVMDSIFQISVLSQWNPFGMIIVGLAVVAIPYALARGVSNRIASRLKLRRGGQHVSRRASASRR